MQFVSLTVCTNALPWYICFLNQTTRHGHHHEQPAKLWYSRQAFELFASAMNFSKSLSLTAKLLGFLWQRIRKSLYVHGTVFMWYHFTKMCTIKIVIMQKLPMYPRGKHYTNWKIVVVYILFCSMAVAHSGLLLQGLSFLVKVGIITTYKRALLMKSVCHFRGINHTAILYICS